MTTKIDRLITYLSILKETLKLKEQINVNSHYTSVDIELPDTLIIHEHWKSNEDMYHTIEFPVGDIDKRIKIARDHLRYLKKRPDGIKHGE